MSRAEKFEIVLSNYYYPKRDRLGKYGKRTFNILGRLIQLLPPSRKRWFLDLTLDKEKILFSQQKLI